MDFIDHGSLAYTTLKNTNNFIENIFRAATERMKSNKVYGTIIPCIQVHALMNVAKAKVHALK